MIDRFECLTYILDNPTSSPSPISAISYEAGDVVFSLSFDFFTRKDGADDCCGGLLSLFDSRTIYS